MSRAECGFSLFPRFCGNDAENDREYWLFPRLNKYPPTAWPNATAVDFCILFVETRPSGHGSLILREWKSRRCTNATEDARTNPIVRRAHFARGKSTRKILARKKFDQSNDGKRIEVYRNID